MLTTQALLNTRLSCLQITNSSFTGVGALIKYMGAMQAQDYSASKWAFGLRVPGCSEYDIERAIADKQVIRTWALRGTLHFLSPADIHWILALIRPRLAYIYGSYYRNLGLTPAVIMKSQSIIRQILINNKCLTRDEISAALQAKKIKTGEMRINFLLLRAALDGLICFGPRRGKQFTFVLLDEWIKPGKSFTGDKALAELASRYFRSHGPATVQDFAWWSGLTQAEIKKSMEGLGDQLKFEEFHSRQYIMHKDCRFSDTGSSVYLLPAFDEYLVGFKERKFMIEEGNTRRVIGANGLFSPLIVINGKIAGTWTRKIKRQGMTIETTLFKPVSQINVKKIARETKAIASFYQMDLVSIS